MDAGRADVALKTHLFSAASNAAAHGNVVWHATLPSSACRSGRVMRCWARIDSCSHSRNRPSRSDIPCARSWVSLSRGRPGRASHVPSDAGLTEDNLIVSLLAWSSSGSADGQVVPKRLSEASISSRHSVQAKGAQLSMWLSRSRRAGSPSCFAHRHAWHWASSIRRPRCLREPLLPRISCRPDSATHHHRSHNPRRREKSRR